MSASDRESRRPGPCLPCLSRREFLLRAGGAAAVATTLVGCGDGQLSSPLSLHQGGGGNGGGGGGGGGLNGQPFVVGDFPELAQVGRIVAVTTAIAAKRVSNSPVAFDAFDMTCTHQNCLTNVVSESSFVCPCHNSQFDGNGNVTHGPATAPLRRYATSYDASTDTLTIDAP